MLNNILSRGTKGNEIQKYNGALENFHTIFQTIDGLDEAAYVGLETLMSSVEEYNSGIKKATEVRDDFIGFIDSLNLDKSDNLMLKKQVPGFEDIAKASRNPSLKQKLTKNFFNLALILGTGLGVVRGG